jgi:hypothetical protein
MLDVTIQILFTILVGIIIGLIWRLYERIINLEKMVARINEDVKWLVKYLNGNVSNKPGDSHDNETT